MFSRPKYEVDVDYFLWKGRAMTDEEYEAYVKNFKPQIEQVRKVI